MNTARFLSVLEHAHYPFVSYPRQHCETVLFPGCAFSSQFPKTTDELVRVCREAGYGIVYDCCGSSVAAFGEQAAAERVLRKLRKRLAAIGCKRIILVCPNCIEYLEGKVDCEIVPVFDVLDELGIERANKFESGQLFIPCPDKKTRVLEKKARSSCDLSNVTNMEKVACCGLRADIVEQGPQTVLAMSQSCLDQAGTDTIYGYCAACLGQFSRMGHTDCRHLVSVMLGVNEVPDSGKAILNRAKRTFDRNTSPISREAAREEQ